MHRLDAFVVSSRELIRCENIFGVVVVDFQQPVEFPFFRFQRMKLLRHLHIELFILPYCDKVDLAAAGFADIDSIASAAKLLPFAEMDCNAIFLFSTSTMRSK